MKRDVIASSLKKFQLKVSFYYKMDAIICGLGNPGPEYERTRHNLGFLTVGQLALDNAQADWQKNKKFKGLVSEMTFDGQQVLLLKPITYMNLSGLSLGPAMQFYKIKPEKVLVVVDDVDLDYGRVKIKEKGSPGGHNGLKSIHQQIGGDYCRLRGGVGDRQAGNLANHVLGRFNSEEYKSLEVYLKNLATACRAWVKEGTDYCMNTYNNQFLNGDLL